METFKIRGGRRLFGETAVQGAKNSALPCLAATVLAKNCVLYNCPDLKDTRAALNILKGLGIDAKFQDNTVITHRGENINCSISDSLMKEMRSSVMFLGAILARCKRAEISYPGGCSIGARPIDLHLGAFLKMGAQIKEEGGRIFCSLDKVNDAKIRLDFPSVGATENIMLLAAESDAEIEISNAAREPEILDLQNFLNAMGASIESRGGNVFIKGQRRLGGAEYKIMPDRIAALTYLCAVAACGGRAKILGARAEHMEYPLEILRRAGSKLKISDDGITINSPRRSRALGFVETAPYPAFPTDAQAIFMAVAAKAKGKSVFKENIFENRFRHVGELLKLGARIETKGNTAYLKGRHVLHGGKLAAQDLRGGAALLIAALSSRGESEISNIGYIDRGYEKIERSLGDFGAEIVRVK